MATSITGFTATGCNAIVSGATLACVDSDALNNILKDFLVSSVCSKCSYDGFALANGFDSSCISSYEPAGTSRDASQCTSMKGTVGSGDSGSWINRCDNYVSVVCVIGTLGI